MRILAIILLFMVGRCTSESSSTSSCTSAGDVCESSLSRSTTVSEIAGQSENSSFTTLSGKSATHAVNEYKVTYVSQASATYPRATALVLLPDGTAPSGGYKIVVWNHGTTGTADTCAPSTTSTTAYQLPSFVRSFAGRGLIVVAPDYQGLGASGPHSYLVKEPTAISIWDAVRAADKLATSQGLSVAKDVFLIGHSQGGGATLFAYEYADSAYNQGYSLKGAVASAPAPMFPVALELALSYTASSLPTKVLAFIAAHFYAIAKFNSALTLTAALSSGVASGVTDNAESLCMDDLKNISAFNSLTTSQALNSDLQTVITNAQSAGTTYAAKAAVYANTVNGWGNALRDNSPGTFSSKTTPLWILQGTSDTTVLKSWTDAMKDHIIANNASLSLTYEVVTGASHDTIIQQYDKYVDHVFQSLP